MMRVVKQWSRLARADDIDLKPWLGKWMQDNIALETAQFSLEGWMTIDKGDVTGGDVWLKQGGASWLGERKHIRCRWII